ncbi:FMN-binding negative transcriptional regulator [Actinocorallia longicatena]|uniref:FMN-binding negative transcriptional regulator n=1 Tax=Actinocorallia longicatena TaxID=111803 RepID=A0ABP6QG94_9ACTN
MLLHPWDVADDGEWRDWLLEGRAFGQLVAGGRDRDLPVVVPTHFLFDGAEIVRLHLARPNPVWPLLEEHPRALLTVVDDYVYAESEWMRDEGQAVEDAVPTSFYATVHLACDVRIIDDPEEKAEILNRQLVHFEPPESERLPVPPDDRNLKGIRGLELTVTEARAKFKYAGNKTGEVRDRVSRRLAERRAPRDRAARALLDRRR